MKARIRKLFDSMTPRPETDIQMWLENARRAAASEPHDVQSSFRALQDFERTGSILTSGGRRTSPLPRCD